MDNVDNFYILQVLLVGRVVVGAAIGVASAVVPVYISEVIVLNHCFHYHCCYNLSIIITIVVISASAVVPVYISEVSILNHCYHQLFQSYIHRIFPLLK